MIKNQWKQATLLKRVSLGGGVFFVVVMLIWSSLWAFREDYQVLFSDLGAQDAAAMINELDHLKVPYQIADDGATILVARDVVYKTRLKLMGKGLNLQGSVGFEIFNNSEFGMTEFAQKVNYQRALQGELARTIMGFDEIKSARVHLVLPESGLFKRQNAKPKASVSVLMKADASLSQEQVSGIQRLVAASVPEIGPNEVTVMDQRGMAVSKRSVSGDGDEPRLHERLDTKQQLEDYMTRKIMTVVDKAVGPGKAIVSVDVALNYDQIKVVKEDVVPLPNTSGQDVGAVTRRKESSQGDGLLNGMDVIQAKQGMGSTSAMSTSDIEYANSRHVEQILSSPGNILRLNVGVLLPETSDRIKLEKLKEVISMAAGINVGRGDGLAVYSVDLPATPSASEIDAPIPAIQPVGNEKHSKQGTASLIFSKELNFLILGVLTLLGIAFVFSQRDKNKSVAKLSSDERNKLLNEISEWAKLNPLESAK